MEDKEFNIKDLHFEFDLSKANYEIDVLQNRLLQVYLRADPKFRRAFSTNYTNDFFQFLKDKARLREPVHISVMGQIRTFTNNNFIYTNKGWRNPSNMEDCQSVLSWNFDSEKYEWKKFELVSRKRDLKEKFFKITLSDNRIIELGENHPIFTLNKGWKKACSLYPDIKMPFFLDYPQQEYKNEISIEKARILAFILSCGHLKHSTGRYLDKRDNKIYNKESWVISYVSSSKEMVNLFREDMKKEFDLTPYYKKKRTEEYKGIEVEVGSKKIVQELSKDIPIGKKSHIIEIPKSIFNASKEIQREFIATLFSGDGYVSDCKKGMALVEYYTMSDKFAQQLHLILLQYGIIPYILKKKLKSGNFINRVCITNKQNLINFANFVQELPNPKKNQRLKEIVNSFIPIRKHLKALKFSIKNKEEFENKEEFVYDIFVEDNNNFFLNGILTHNSGKSYSSISICVFIMALFGKKFTIEYIVGNAMEFLEKLRTMPEEKLKDSCFLIDEEKTAIFNLGSIAKKTKLQDVQNIIALNNISTISLNPISWANREASYGLRVFGRCFSTKTTRCMLYNLMEKGRGGELPLGNVYIPSFVVFLPKPYADELEKEYLTKKKEWVRGEMRGEGDILAELRKKSAESFCRDEKFNSLTKKGEKITYISLKLGSEWTKGEVEQIYEITKLLNRGILEESE